MDVSEETVFSIYKTQAEDQLYLATQMVWIEAAMYSERSASA